MRTIALTVVAMVAFAANSVLARLAFATAGAEPLSYTGIRLAAGAVTLAILLLARDASSRSAAHGAAPLRCSATPSCFRLPTSCSAPAPAR